MSARMYRLLLIKMFFTAADAGDRFLLASSSLALLVSPKMQKMLLAINALPYNA